MAECNTWLAVLRVWLFLADFFLVKGIQTTTNARFFTYKAKCCMGLVYSGYLREKCAFYIYWDCDKASATRPQTQKSPHIQYISTLRQAI